MNNFYSQVPESRLGQLLRTALTHAEYKIAMEDLEKSFIGIRELERQELREKIENKKISLSRKVRDGFVSNIALREVQKYERSYNQALQEILDLIK